MASFRGLSRSVQAILHRSVKLHHWKRTCTRCFHYLHKNGNIIVHNHNTMRQITTCVNSEPRESDGSYEEAVNCLNTLQSNAAYLAKTAAEKDQRRHHQLPLTLQTAARLGITPDDLDKLSVIHVTGTKGKGSTCAFSESILRCHGYKTGFFSSPHLIEVRERIRIAGCPLSRDAFRSYFWQCYNKLLDTKDQFGGYMPPYFQFLTVMSFYVFIQEQVDVVVLEVGIGGEYDSTNIVRSPVVCGISSLGIDHVSLLGDSMEKIAWHKAGIFKNGIPAITVPQPESPMEVLQDRAYEKKCPLFVAPNSITHYDWGGTPPVIGIPGEKQDINASLAAQLCNVWLSLHDKSLQERKDVYKDFANGKLSKADHLMSKETFQLTEAMVKGIKKCYWPGRCQTIKHPGITYYVDGAHTPRSIQASVQWFSSVSRVEEDSIQGKVLKILIFNSTGDRKADTLLKPLLDSNFDCAVFCPNITTTAGSNKADQTNFMVTNSLMLSKCQENQKTWDHLNVVVDKVVNGAERGDLDVSSSEQESDPDKEAESQNNNCGSEPSSVSFGCILEALHWVSQGRCVNLPQIPINVQESRTIRSAEHVQVLCTGSLHLVGGILGLIEPNICEITSK